MAKRKIYISGPMSGATPGEVTERFKAAEKFLEKTLGEAWAIINPAEIYPGTDGDNLEHGEWVRLNKALLSMCDAIFLLPGWEHSKGAIAELKEASTLGLDINGMIGATPEDGADSTHQQAVYFNENIENAKDAIKGLQLDVQEDESDE